MGDAWRDVMAKDRFPRIPDYLRFAAIGEPQPRHGGDTCARAYEARALPIKLIDLREYVLPLCDGEGAYEHPHVTTLSALIEAARVIVVATPIYNYDANATAKNLVELTGSAWENKTVGFLCAAGGASSYMSIMGLANSLMLDFRCLIIPRFVYAKGEDFTARRSSRRRTLPRESTALAERQ